MPGSLIEGGRELGFLQLESIFSTQVHLLELIVSESPILLENPEKILVTAPHNKAIV